MMLESTSGRGKRGHSRLFVAGLLVALVLSMAWGGARAEASWLDLSFGDQGKVSGTSLEMYSDGWPDLGMSAVTQDPEGRILVGHVGRIARLLKDGTPDPEFGANGTVDFVEALGLEPGVLADGAPMIRSIAVQPDGGIVVAGYTVSQVAIFMSPFLFRLNPDGTADRSFGRDGFMGGGDRRLGSELFVDMTLDSHGRILVAGPQYNVSVMVRRFTPDGQVDRTFGRNGRTRIQSKGIMAAHMLSSVQVERSGRILAGGTIRARPVIVALRPNGRLDRRFGRKGFAWGVKVPPIRCDIYVEMCSIGDLVRTSNGRLVLGSRVTFNRWRYSYDILSAFRKDGTPIRGFGRRGKLILTSSKVARGTGRPSAGALAINDVVALSRGRVFVLGATSIAAGRRKVGLLVNRRGRVIPVKRPVFIGPEHWQPTSGAAAAQRDGKVLVASWEVSGGDWNEMEEQDPALFRLNVPR